MAAAVTLAGLLSAGSPAQAQCPEGHGTVPGTPRSVKAVGPVYVDDRGLVSADPGADSGGLWVYLESNGVQGLQRGGEWFAGAAAREAAEDAGLPSEHWVRVDPVEVGPFTLFPNGHDCLAGYSFEPRDSENLDCGPRVQPGYTDCGDAPASGQRSDTLLF